MLTPDLQWNFPRWEFVVFFGLHGLVLVAALLLVFGLGLRPRPGAPLRVLGITAGWAALVAPRRTSPSGTNFMYLRARPAVGDAPRLDGPLAASTSARRRSWHSRCSSCSRLPFRREWRAGQPWTR